MISTILFIIALFSVFSYAAFISPGTLYLRAGHEENRRVKKAYELICYQSPRFQLSMQLVLLASLCGLWVTTHKLVADFVAQNEIWVVSVSAMGLLVIALFVFISLPYVLLIRSSSDRFGRWLAWPAVVVYAVVFVPVLFASELVAAFMRFFGVSTSKLRLSHQPALDLESLLRYELEPTANDDGGLDEVKMLHNALELKDVHVHECVVPRTEIVYVDKTDDEATLLRAFTESGKSKVLVCDEDLDHVLGYIHSSELFKRQKPWTASIVPMPCVPEQMSASKLLQLLMQEKRSLAVVVDEFGGTTGIVSIEDVIEEILGDIQDEHDYDNYTARKIGDSEMVLSARMEIDQVNEKFGISLPEDEDYITLAGLILHFCQRIPRAGELVQVGEKYTFKILKATPRKVELVRLEVDENAGAANK